jgi:flagellar biosynthesis/type III secretory pathway protein FliH
MKTEKRKFHAWIETFMGREISVNSGEFAGYWAIYQKGKREGVKQGYEKGENDGYEHGSRIW